MFHDMIELMIKGAAIGAVAYGTYVGVRYVCYFIYWWFWAPINDNKVVVPVRQTEFDNE